jgi:putative urate catabolism protein
MSMESIYEYGARAGVWRLLREFEQRKLPLTVFGVAMALERNPEATAAFVALGHEIAAHGLRWLNYQNVDAEIEAAHMRRAVEVIAKLTGSAPLGWYTGRDSPNTRRLVVEHGGFLYDADSYGDDLPYWTVVSARDGRASPHLVVPYTLDANDMRFATSPGFGTADHFFTYLRDAFDVLYAEGAASPKMLSIGMHCRLLGRPGRFRALQRFLDHVEAHDRVWVCRRVDIARHWIARHPFDEGKAP